MLIAQLQPHYNAYYLSNIKGRINNYMYRANFKKLLRRNIRLTHTRTIQDDRFDNMSGTSRHHAMVAALCTPSYRGFLAQKIMLKHSTPGNTVYAYKRMVQHVPNHKRGTGMYRLKKVFQIRKLQWPATFRPLAVPFLAHGQFQHDMKQFLRHILTKNKRFNLPFHLPKHALTESKYLKVANLLYNHWEAPLTAAQAT